MKVDIIIPTYNPSLHILEAIESCVKQTYDQIKITVINDSSTKDISFIKKKYPNINLLNTDKNLGPGGARNLGILKTNYELVSFLDDDDIMHQDKIKNSVEAFQKNKNIGMICGNYCIMASNRVMKPFYKDSINIDYNDLIKRNRVACGSVTLKRNVLDNIGFFNEDYWIAEDYDLWLRVSEKYPVEYIHKVLYFYRIRPGSLTQRTDIQEKHVSNISKIRAESIKRMSCGTSK